ncbi:MAG: hypothetical protein QJR13_02240, partial [Bacillota bacterium]|nr:hypothetical protein [Bacillota bacterium]
MSILFLLPFSILDAGCRDFSAARLIILPRLLLSLPASNLLEVFLRRPALGAGPALREILEA